MSFLRTFQHLLPDGAAWRLRVGTMIRKLFDGLTGAPTDAVAFVDDVHDDLYPSSTRALVTWEEQFALPGAGTDATRRLALDAAWKATGGQSPRYLQDVVQAAGFTNLFIHEWWASGPPYVARDPRLYTRKPLIGTVQCGEARAQCGERSAQCNDFLANDPGYLVNLDLTPRPPPPVPDDSSQWPFFLYWGAQTFGELAFIDAVRRAELEELLLRLCPTQQWLVLLIRWKGAERITLQGDGRITLQGDNRVTRG